jgi:hypothetical protein
MGLSTDVIDDFDNRGTGLTERRAVDLAQVALPSIATGFTGGLLRILGASDGVHAGIADPGSNDIVLSPGSLGLLRNFDGTGRLYDQDATIFTSLLRRTDPDHSEARIYPITLYYDVDPPVDTDADFPIFSRPFNRGTFWLPSILPGFNLKANTEARSVSPFLSSGDARNFRIPASDPEIKDGASVGFLFRYGPLWIARASDILDPTAFDLWRYKIQDVLTQRGGVTILNNVINSLKKERTAVQIDLQEPGQATVLVFTLDGDVVKALHRGRLGRGSYTLTWDGTNTGGTPVARGMYFIRVVAPGIDEIRKVMVIKE